MLTTQHSLTLSEAQVTLYKDAFDKTGEVRTIAKCLDNIRSHPTLAKWIAELRPLYWKAEELRPFKNDSKAAKTAHETAKGIYDEAKKKLPAVTFSGTFTRRATAGLAVYTGILQADLDHLKEKGFDSGEIKNRVSLDPHVLFCFVSPSGDGLKIGIRVTTGPEHHAEAFVAMQRYFVATHGVKPDDACKDVCRLCFLSHDPSVFVNEHATAFDWSAWPEPAVDVGADDDDETVNPLPLDALPLVMQQLSSACAEVYLVDVALPAASALTVMGAAFGKSLACEGAANGRTTPCGLDTVIGAPSGYGKGVVGVVAKPLVDASKELGKQFTETVRPQLLADIAIAECEKKALLAEIRDGTKKKNEARAELGKLEADIGKWTFECEQVPVLYAGSGTGPALGVALMRNGEQLLSFALEAGDAIRVAAGKFSKDSKGDYDLLLSGYTGEPFSDARVTRNPIRLEAPSLSILWCVQPVLMRELYGTAEAQDRGMLARFNPVQCEHDVIPEDDGIRREVPSAVAREWDTLVRAALDMRKTERRLVFRADDGAREVFRQSHNEAVSLRNGEGREAESKLMRCRENAIRCATIIAGTEWLAAGGAGATPPLTAEHAARGVAWARYFLQQSLNLTSGAAFAMRQKRLAEVLELVTQAGGSITLRRLRDHHGVGETELRQIVARNADKLRIETPPSGSKGGRPSPRLIAIEK